MSQHCTGYAGNPKSQVPNPKLLGGQSLIEVWYLEFTWGLGFGIWDFRSPQANDQALG
jgi:hypothetical protein